MNKDNEFGGRGEELGTRGKVTGVAAAELGVWVAGKALGSPNKELADELMELD